MSMPLSPRSPAALNRLPISLAPDAEQFSKSPAASPAPSFTNDHQSSLNATGPPSSPFQTDVAENFLIQNPLDVTEKENLAPSEVFEIHDDEISNDIQIKLSPKKQSSSRKPLQNTSPNKVFGDETLTRLREEIFSVGPKSITPNKTTNPDDIDEQDTHSTISDDTCFSTFSAVPNTDMTKFANIGMPHGERANRSPSRRANPSQTPSHGAFFTPGTSNKHRSTSSNCSPSPSPTPRQQKSRPLDGDTTNLLLDFTQPFDSCSRKSNPSPTRRALSPTKTEPNLLSYINTQRMPSPVKGGTATPASKRSVLNLLDFDLPPQPTPRSVPTITIREIESMKSTYLSEISSLKANLSGKDAEVDSLKTAVGDAERRVGEALESMREERNAREHAEKEKSEWEKKGQEVECVLQNVREAFVYAEKEKEDLLQKLEESHQLREEAELKADECATKANVAQSEVGLPDEENGNESSVSEAIISQRVAQQLDERMENLARELHAVYKKKHESKVATLKKTYEMRSEKKCTELQQKIEELSQQNDVLQASKDATFSGELPNSLPSRERSQDLQQLELQNAELQEQKAKIAGFGEEINSLKNSHAQLLQDLERERVEKGELVAAVDEMLALQSEVGAPSAVEDFRKSIGRPPSGLKAPKQPTGLAKPTNFGKSKMMSNIERMGGSRGP